MAKLFNLAQMTTATAGTGTITLGSAVAPFITFAAAGVQNNDVVAYSIIDGANSEMGYGTYSAAGPTLTRNLRKSSTGALLNLSGSAIVRLTPGREDIINSDGSIAFVANLDMGSNRIINVSDPTGTQDVATKNYVDVAISGVTGSGGSGHNPVTLGTANGLVLSNQVLSLDLASSTVTGSLSAADWTIFNNKQAALGFTPENVANKDIDAALTSNSDTKYPSQKAVKAYVDAGLATGTHAPVTLGTANGLSLSGQQLSLGFSSGTSSGALSGSDWQLFNSKQAALGFTPENVANKTQLVRSSGTSSTLYPSESAVSSFVSTAISSIPSASGNIGSFLLSGGGVTWVTGYQFRVSAAQYYIQGVLYSSAEQLITLVSSDATYDRIDVIVVNTSGQVDKVTGVANSSPSEPDIDPATQLQLAFIIVYAASSSPIIHSQTIYSEDAGSPTEWNWSSTGSTWNLASTNNPFAGTKDIEATSLGANAYAQGMATGTVNLGIYTQLNFYVRSKATWNAGRGLYVAWYSNGVRKGNNVFLAHGFFNFNSDNTTDYQLISIPISQFAVPNGTTVNQLRFTRVGGAIGFYLDEIVVTDSGLTSTPVGLTQEQADARYVLKRDFATWFNVRDYGAIGNGLVNDTLAVTNAISALNTAGGGTLYFPAGTYLTSGSFTISAPALVLGEGSGDGLLTNSVSKITCSSASAVLFTVAQHGCAFRDIALQNIASSTPTSTSAGIKVTSGDRTFYEHVAIRGFYINLDIQDGGEQRIIACWFISPVKYGVKFQHIDSVDWGGLYLWGTAFYSETYNADAGLRVESGGGISIIGCAFNSWNGPTYQFVTPIDVAPASGVVTGHFEVISTGIENFSGNGIRVATSSSTWWQFVFVGNEISKFSNSLGNAIWVQASNLGEIKDVIIDNLIARTAGATPDVIYLEKVNNAIIGNVLIENGYTNILAQLGCTNVSMDTRSAIGTYTDNSIVRIDGTTGDTLQGSGITIADGSSGFLSGTNTGDQNLFKSIAVSGQSTIFADTPTKALTFAGTGGIVLSTVTGTATVTIDGSGITGTTITQVAISGLPIYDDSVFKVTGTALSFDNNLAVNVTGTVAYISSSGGGTGSVSVATDAIWDTKGDLAVGTGADTAAKLAVGANLTVLTPDSTQTTGLRWSNGIHELLATSSPSGTGTVTFSSISANYNHLEIIVIARSTQSAAATEVTIQLNTDSTATNYRRTFVQGLNSTASSSGADDSNIATIAGDTSPTNSAGIIRIYIPFYSTTTYNKQVHAQSSWRLDNSSSQELLKIHGMEWENTAAINQIDLVLGSGNWKNGSKVYLYGII